MDLRSLCPNGSFHLIDSESQSLGDCFVNTVLLMPSYLLFSLVNGFLIGYSTDLSRHYRFFSIRLMRFVSFLFVLLSLISVFVKYFLDDYFDLNSITFPLIVDIYQLFAFSLHSLLIFNKSVFSFNPSCLLVSFLILFLTNLVSFINYSYLNWTKLSTFDLNSLEKFTFFNLASLNFLLLVYNLTLFVSLSNKKCRARLVKNNYAELNTNEASKIDSRAEEDKANYLSYLTFEWLKPVMIKGFKREIEQVEHLSQIPLDLNVSKVCDRFMSKYWPTKASQHEHTNNPILKPDLLLDDEYIQNMTNVYEDDNLNLEIEISRKNLASALMRCFGRKFFLLGIFKLTNDVINFSGPLLLNQLVQFVENKDSSLKNGCMYGTALLLTTLVGSVINIHFTNALNKLCLRIRTAMITLIYRKAILVRLDQLNKFSTGQIVNYMSIDTDSVVNAFPSFHSFWSLPFQITITLYLLYSQIGISFVSRILNKKRGVIQE